MNGFVPETNESFCFRSHRAQQLTCRLLQPLFKASSYLMLDADKGSLVKEKLRHIKCWGRSYAVFFIQTKGELKSCPFWVQGNYFLSNLVLAAAVSAWIFSRAARNRACSSLAILAISELSALASLIRQPL